MGLKLSGKIMKGNKEVGHYSYSFASGRYSFTLNGVSQHFYKEDELIQYITELGYSFK
jgi:hypothetical protein